MVIIAAKDSSSSYNNALWMDSAKRDAWFLAKPLDSITLVASQCDTPVGFDGRARMRTISEQASAQYNAKNRLTLTRRREAKLDRWFHESKWYLVCCLKHAYAQLVCCYSRKSHSKLKMVFINNIYILWPNLAHNSAFCSHIPKMARLSQLSKTIWRSW